MNGELVLHDGERTRSLPGRGLKEKMIHHKDTKDTEKRDRQDLKTVSVSPASLCPLCLCGESAPERLMQHLLGLEDLTRDQIVRVLDAAEGYVGVGLGDVPKRTDLKGKVVANLFYEPSTRTKISFGLAARRLGADTLDFSPGGSSTAKGETFIDTAKNIEAMGIDAVVVRHASAGAPHLLAQHLRPHVRVVNAGDGAHEHPTQGLLDIFTIRRGRGRDRRADGRAGRRHRPQPGRPQQHPRADEARGEGDRLRPDDAGPAEVARLGVEVAAQPGRRAAAVRRGEPAAGAVRAAADRAVPVGPRVRATCSG